MTPERQRAQQREWIIASLMLGETRADRHGVYPRRWKPAPPVVPVVPDSSPLHVFVVPVVTEKSL